MKNYCGNIQKNCPNKTQDGVCKVDGYLPETCTTCKFLVETDFPEIDFLIKYAYNIYNGTKSVINISNGIYGTWPENLYCEQIEKFCPHQTLGGKCNRRECLIYDQNCPSQIDFGKDIELITRLLQRIHIKIENQQKQIQELQQKLK
jgi:hypothetical protein